MATPSITPSAAAASATNDCAPATVSMSAGAPHTAVAARGPHGVEALARPVGDGHRPALRGEPLHEGLPERARAPRHHHRARRHFFARSAS